jgi:CrcB protein
MLRYVVAMAMATHTNRFPFATLLVNVAGCFCIGLASTWLLPRPGAGATVRPLVVIGMLGGFTTFSAFGSETWALVQSGRPMAAGANALLNVALGLAAVVAGMRLAQHL